MPLSETHSFNVLTHILYYKEIQLWKLLTPEHKDCRYSQNTRIYHKKTQIISLFDIFSTFQLWFWTDSSCCRYSSEDKRSLYTFQSSFRSDTEKKNYKKAQGRHKSNPTDRQARPLCFLALFQIFLRGKLLQMAKHCLF